MNWKIGKVEKGVFVRVTLEGDFDINDFCGIFGDLFSREYWRTGLHILFDDSMLNLSDTNYEIIRHASDCYSENYSHIGDGKIALLMHSVSDFGRGRQFQILTEMKVPANLQVFMDEAEAVIWLTANTDLFKRSAHDGSVTYP